MIYPMQDILVIDLTQIYNGPYATYLMALAGADIIKVEPPGGEPLRRRGAVGGAALPFAMLNGGKKSVVIDLKTENGHWLPTTTPGLGIEVNEEAAKRHPFKQEVLQATTVRAHDGAILDW